MWRDILNACNEGRDPRPFIQRLYDELVQEITSTHTELDVTLIELRGRLENVLKATDVATLCAQVRRAAESFAGDLEETRLQDVADEVRRLLP